MTQRLAKALDAAGRNDIAVAAETVARALKLISALAAGAPGVASITDLSIGADGSVEFVASLPGHCIEIFITPGDDAFDVLSENRESGDESEDRFATVNDLVTKLASLDAA